MRHFILPLGASFTAAVLACSSHRIVGWQEGDAGVVVESDAADTDVDPGLTEAGEDPAFPKDPIVTGGAPNDAADQFSNATPGTGAGPCMVEPSPNALYPKNWMRPRFRWNAAQGETLFEIKLHVANQANDLVVYTAKSAWTMNDEIWKLLRVQSNDLPIDVTVRSLAGNKVYVGTKEQVQIAPVDAPGSVVYWTTASANVEYDAKLKGFKIGDETVVEVLAPKQAGSTNACVACHSSTPDGKFTGVNLAGSISAGGWATADVRSVDGKGTQPSYLTSAAKQILARGMTQLPVFSAGHFKQGDRIMGATYTNSSIIWIDLEAQSAQQDIGWGVFARTGDPQKPAMAAFSHDGSSIVYTSTADPTYGAGCIVKSGELRTIPWNNRKGGTSTPIAGSHAQGFMEYYPSFSPDDRLVAFTRAPENGTVSYDNKLSESWVVPAAGGTPLRFAANDPPSCMNAPSPGITNSWPKWSPQVLVDGAGRKLYFIVFSSRRDASLVDSKQVMRPQLYVTTIIDDGQKLTSTGALYVGNQPGDENNHTPAWDVFDLPPPPK